MDHARSGVPDVRILSGIVGRLVTVGGQVAKKETHPQPKTLDLKNSLPPGRPPRISFSHAGGPGLRFSMLAGSTAEFCGDRATAKSTARFPAPSIWEWSACIDPKTKKFKSFAGLHRSLFQDHKIDVNKPAITYCQSGGRASVMAFALELMGGNQVQNYYQNWPEGATIRRRQS